MKVIFIEKSKNKADTPIALAKLPNGTFAVYLLRGNYSGYAKGGVIYSWLYFVDNVKNANEKTARELFKKKLKGKAK